jgi:hypothetical protein
MLRMARRKALKACCRQKKERHKTATRWLSCVLVEDKLQY